MADQKPSRFRVVSPDVPPSETGVIDFVVDFDDTLEGNAIREERDAHGHAVWIIAACWRPISDDFGQQVLNRRFVKALLQHKPATLHVDLLCGATLDFVRIASYLGLNVSIKSPVADCLPAPGSRAARWLADAVRCAASIHTDPMDPGHEAFAQSIPAVRSLPVEPRDGAIPSGEEGQARSHFGYEAYAFSQREHALLYEMQRYHVDHYPKDAKVLDLGCGTGIFLDALSRAGIDACGVERNDLSVRYARGLGHEVIESGALEFLEETALRFSGVYCSHFVEHLPFDAVERLVRGITRVLTPGGVAVFVFPDPESIRSQFLGFWRDPEHVRFYHPDLVELVCWMNELECEYQSQRLPLRKVVSFSMQPPWADGVEEGEPAAVPDEGLVSRCLGRLGFVTKSSQARTLARLARLEARDRMTREAVSKLWDVNQTWAWEDNAVMRFRKPV